MGRDDWYRRTTWTDDDQREFWARWSRSRTAFHNAQYLRIQACTLIDQPDPVLIRCGIDLTRRMLNEFPDERSEIAVAQSSIGDGLARLGSFEAALEAYRSAVETERAYPNAKTGAARSFALLVAAMGLREHDVEAESMLDASRAGQMGGAFPFEIFIDAGARAVFAANRGVQREAARWAGVAVEQAGRTASGLEHHPGVGLVPEGATLFRALLDECRRLAGS